MIIVADTTPLISLMKIGHLHLINELFGEVLVPAAVYRELVTNSRFLSESKQIMESPFIKRVDVENIQAVDLLRRANGLDAGESEAIILSDSVNASLLLMDEARGRQVARQMGIQIMGTIGILLAAYQEKKLTRTEILVCIETLKTSGRHISNELYAQLIDKING